MVVNAPSDHISARSGCSPRSARSSAASSPPATSAAPKRRAAVRLPTPAGPKTRTAGAAPPAARAGRTGAPRARARAPEPQAGVPPPPRRQGSLEQPQGRLVADHALEGLRGVRHAPRLLLFGPGDTLETLNAGLWAPPNLPSGARRREDAKE